MTGWLLILSLLLLGGVLATLGDRLGSRVGKARLSLFNLRPKRTAVVITVVTGSLISALSLGFMLLVSRQLRVGLFELDDLQEKLRSSRKELIPLQQQRKLLEDERIRLIKDISIKDKDIERTESELYIVRKRISEGEKELKQLESNLIALRSGDVVLGSGQSLAMVSISLKKSEDARKVINGLLQEANLEAFKRVRPGDKNYRQIILVPRGDIKRLEEIIRKKGTWVINIRSAANVLRGEKLVYAFPEVRENTLIINEGEVLARTTLEESERTSNQVRNRIKLLLASALTEAKRRGSLVTGLQFNSDSINQLGQVMLAREQGTVELEAIAIRTSDISEPVAVLLQIRMQTNKKDINRRS